MYIDEIKPVFPALDVSIWTIVIKYKIPIIYNQRFSKEKMCKPFYKTRVIIKHTNKTNFLKLNKMNI
jgi:hypothetical protein